MTNRQLDEEAIFHVARELFDPVIRDTYLNQICGGDQALRDRVDRLLGAHEAERGLLASQNGGRPTAAQTPVRESLGQHIGRYKLLQKST